MTTNEQKLQRIMQKAPQGHNPFSVPEGYFSSLQARVMDKIKQEEEMSRQAETAVTQGENTSMPFAPAQTKTDKRLWMRLTAAAVFTGLFSVIGTMLYRQHQDATSLPSENVTSMSDITDLDYNDDLLDYAMLSNSDIACYLTSAE